MASANPIAEAWEQNPEHRVGFLKKLMKDYDVRVLEKIADEERQENKGRTSCS